MTMDTSDPITEPVIEHSSAGAKLAGGEACLLDAAVEEQGVADIRQALTEEERNQIPHADMPIRHFRAVKVRKEFTLSRTFAIDWLIYSFLLYHHDLIITVQSLMLLHTHPHYCRETCKRQSIASSTL
jgi:hypothetical protein